MELSTAALIRAALKLDLPVEIVHTDQNVLRILLPNKTLYVANGEGDWNTQAQAIICKDKSFQYEMFEDLGLFPMTWSFCDPDMADRYEEYRQFDSVESISEALEGVVEYPAIVKPNRGSRGNLVALCDSTPSLISALKQVFDRHSSHYDYVGIVQERLDIEQEYRVIMIGGIVHTVIRKDISEAQFVGNLSPLHWEGARAIIETDTELKQEIQTLLDPMYARFPIHFTGLDIVKTTQGDWKVIELNANPGFTRLAHDQGEEPVDQIYIDLLRSLL